MKLSTNRYLFILGLSLVSCNLACAQFGFMIGGGATDIIFLETGQSPYLGYENNSLVHNYPLPSFQAGVLRQFDISDRFGASIGIHYSLQGLDYSTRFLHDIYGFRIAISYLRMPVLIQIKTNVAKSKRSGLLLGPYVSTALVATKTTCIEDVKKRSPLDNVNPFDAGGIVGYSWDIDKNSDHLYIDLLASYSLFNMMEVLNGSPKYYGPEKELARNISFILALKIML